MIKWYMKTSLILELDTIAKYTSTNYPGAIA